MTSLTTTIGRSETQSMIDKMQLKIRRSHRRRTAAITIYRTGKIVVAVPTHYTNQSIRELIALRQAWIIKKIKQFAAQSPAPPPAKFVENESFLYLGENHNLKIVGGVSPGVTLKDRRLVVAVPRKLQDADQARLVKNELTKWYTMLALKTLNARVEHYNQRLGTKPTRIGVRYYKSRWGVCKPNGEIVFNWCLIMAPIHVIDYVVVHELCHLRVPNHSRAFWRLVESILPDYKQSKRWLRKMPERYLAPFGSGGAS